jgi:hypothetical protein
MSLPRHPFALTAVLLLGACQGRTGNTTQDSRPGTPPPAKPATPPDPDRPIDPGSTRTQAQVREHVAHLADENPLERIAAARSLAALGEPSLPALFETLERHPSGRSRGMAAYTLGFMDDRRAVEPLARALTDSVTDVRYEAAAALLRLGDDRGLAPLITGLEDPDPRLRARSLGNLKEAVHETFGFQPDGDPLERSAAVARWRGWLQRRREGRS